MKIPFERTVAGAYRFAFANILSILGIGWFPVLLLGLLFAGLVYTLMPQLTALTNIDPSRADATEFMSLVFPMMGAVLLFIAAAFVVQAMLLVGIIRKAFGNPPGPVFFFFSLGAQVWRMIGAYLLLMLLAWGVIIALTLGISIISFLLSKISGGVQVLVTTLLVCAAIVWGIYAVVRVQFFLPAVVIAENHIGIRRSWHLGRGNFWRIIGIVILVILPAGIALSTINTVILQLAHLPNVMMMQGWPPNPSHPHLTAAEFKQYFTALFGALRIAWPYLAAAELVYVTVVTGLHAGAIANAYNLVTGAPEIAPPSGSTKAAA